MTMDFNKVKSLTIPEGEVTKITDSSGNVLWKKITKGWHTIWSGTLSLGIYDPTVKSTPTTIEPIKNVPTRVTWKWEPEPGIGTVYYSKFPPDSWWGDYTTTKEETFSGTPEWTNDNVFGLLAISRNESGRSSARILYNAISKKWSIYGSSQDAGLGRRTLYLYKVEQYF